LEIEYGKCGSGMPDLSVVKVSRGSGKGQMENGGKLKGKMNGANRKSGWKKMDRELCRKRTGRAW
jgi:hypothetical protein